MEKIRAITIIIYILICVALSVIVLMQEGESDGLSGAIGGGTGSDTYWSKNKGRSKEGAVEKATKYLAFLFIALSVVLNLI
ncbi:MAG TPA: preprotein translocase subunit SecG [Clostridiales bacterium]|nr:preprotein translocase subunit SecG [Clostridiales bacterium]